ncbi:MAG TPA: clan AA aspartic protease [Bacteroidia bacterium]|nr:clan AA aspartic protease [Bacteroidia bacterium]
MGIVQSKIKLSNAKDIGLKPVEVNCIVDTGATYVCIPESIAFQLKLEELQKRDVKLANGHVTEVPYVGPVKVEFENRICFVGAMVMGDTVLLGAIPMEDMDLVVNPKLQQLTVHPDRPNIPGGLAL